MFKILSLSVVLIKDWKGHCTNATGSEFCLVLFLHAEVNFRILWYKTKLKLVCVLKNVFTRDTRVCDPVLCCLCRGKPSEWESAASWECFLSSSTKTTRRRQRMEQRIRPLHLLTPPPRAHDEEDPCHLSSCK